MIEIFGGIINPIEETFIEVRNGLQNWMIEQKCKSRRNGMDYDEEDEENENDCPFSDIAASCMAANERKGAHGIRGAEKPKTIVVTIGNEKKEVGKKGLKKLYKEMHPGIDKVSEEKLARFLGKICIMEGEDNIEK